MQGRCSILIPNKQLVKRLSDNVCFMSLGAAKFGAICIIVKEIVAGVFQLQEELEVVHATATHGQFAVIPSESCPPCKLLFHYPDMATINPGITFSRTGDDVPLLHFLLSSPITLIKDDLCFVASQLHLEHRQASAYVFIFHPPSRPV